jgi:hypothetical protein
MYSPIIVTERIVLLEVPTMEEALGRSLAIGNTAEIFEWGSRVMKLYKKIIPRQSQRHSERRRRAQL